MATLAKLLADHAPLLVLDAASISVQVGVIDGDARSAWIRPPGDAGTALFAGTAQALQAAGLTLGDIHGFVFCDGPGSMLGIRTAAMALRSWLVIHPRPVFTYDSLALAGRHERAQHPKRDFSIIADARRDSWHCRRFSVGKPPGEIERIGTAELPAGDLVTPENFRTWTKCDRVIEGCCYDVSILLNSVERDDLFCVSSAPDSFQHAAPDYKRWSAQVHSAANAAIR